MCLSLACFCCLSTLRARTIELIALLCNIIIIGLFIWSLIGIPWDWVRKIGKILLFVSLGFSIIDFLLLLILIFLRCQGTINGEKNGCGNCFVITLMIFDTIGFIIVIVAESIILRDMRKDNDNNYKEWKKDDITTGEWLASALSLSLIEILWMINGFCASCLHSLISLRTNGSYADYLKESGESKNNTLSSINGSNQPSVKFIGYDKNGKPIYSGHAVNTSDNPFNRNVENNIDKVKVINDQNNPDLNTNYAIA